MADRIMPGPVDSSACAREAVCVHTRKIYDSCKDKDCIEDLRLYLDTESQYYVNTALSVRARSAELLYVAVDVQEVAFNRGYYTIDIRYYYRIRGEAYSLANKADDIRGLAVFDKRVMLFGSEGNAKIFTSDGSEPTSGIMPTYGSMPTAVVEAVDPILLNIKLFDGCECPGCDYELGELPDFISAAFPSGLVVQGDGRRICVTLGQFSIIRLERDSQLLIPVYDYCMPEKECVGSSEDDPCELFRKIRFPVDEFLPPDTTDCPDVCGTC